MREYTAGRAPTPVHTSARPRTEEGCPSPAEAPTVLRGRVITPTEELADGVVVFTDRISWVGPTDASHYARVPWRDVTVIPGLVDAHCHGGGGVGFPEAADSAHVGALSGGLAAVRKRFDLVGILVLAWAAGLGGGLLRDVLIGAIPPVGISDWRFIAVACLAGVVMYLFHPRLERARRMIAVLDAGALALYTVSGTLKALGLGFDGVTAVSAGILTGIGGGVLRDLLSGEVPIVLHQRQLYAVPAVIGRYSRPPCGRVAP